MDAKTPVRAIRIEDDLWRKAQQIAKELKKETGLSATASDVIRKALIAYIDGRKRK